MKCVICHGRTSEAMIFGWLDEGGLKRPYHVLTMDRQWWDVATALGLPSFFFKDKLRMMRFALAHHGDDPLVAVIAKDKSEETDSMIASFHAMGAVDMSFHAE